MFQHIIEFVIDFFSNITIKKIVGAILVFLGLFLVERIGLSGDIGVGVLFMIGGLLVSGVGLVVIYYDIAKDKQGKGFNELETLTKGYKTKEHEEIESTSWHMDHNSSDDISEDD